MKIFLLNQTIVISCYILGVKCHFSYDRELHSNIHETLYYIYIYHVNNRKSMEQKKD